MKRKKLEVDMMAQDLHQKGKHDRTINWDRAKLERLKDAYAEALGFGVEVFLFEGHEMVVGYARYLIVYLDSKLA